MEILSFELGGKSAFFKKPEVNSYYYFTYGNIHKVALLGIFGAFLGYSGYNQMRGFSKKKRKTDVEESFPEFYEKLRGLNVSILPTQQHEKGFIPKKIQIFNNSVGYASKEQGGNLIVKEQWLENPSWKICVLIDSEEAEKVKTAICKHTCVYYPYLGKNDHPADIRDIQIEQAEEISFKMGRLDCLCPEDKAQIVELDYDEKEELNAFSAFKYQEALPYKLEAWANQYVLKKFIFTDAFMEVKDCSVYQLRKGQKIIFY